MTTRPMATRRFVLGAGSLGLLPRLARAEGSDRVALVIGNGAYTALPGLRNPAHDARAVGQTLTHAGFTLIGGGPQIDIDKAAFEYLVDQFGREAGRVPVALFYYSGHGLQVDGRNWLVPIDARLETRADLSTHFVDVQTVLDQMAGDRHQLGIVILDACRDNPLVKHYKGSIPGLAAMQVAQGTIVSYSTFPGGVALDGDGTNSPFTSALVNVMNRPGLDVINVFNAVSVDVRKATSGRQVPWFSLTGIDGDFRFFGAPAPGPALAPVASAPKPEPRRPATPHPAPARRPVRDMPW